MDTERGTAMFPIAVKKQASHMPTKYALLANEVLAVHVGMEIIRGYLFYEYATEYGADKSGLENTLPECKWPSNISDEKNVLLNQYYSMYFLRKASDMMPSAPLMSYVFFSLDWHNRAILNAAFPSLAQVVAVH